MFWRAKKTGQSIQQSLVAKPLRLVEPEIEPMDNGGARLKVQLRPGRFNKWIFRVPAGSSKSFELDQIGMLVWSLCDGRTSVQQIIRKLASRYKLNLREAEVSTQVFLRTLIRKGLVGMVTPKQTAQKA